MRIGIVAATLALSATCACAALESLMTGIATNVPSSRLTDTTYTSPGGEYAVQVPQLTKPGMRIEEGQVDAITYIWFGDDFGRVCMVELSEVARPQRTVEEIAGTVELDDVVRRKEIVTTSRGSELRAVHVILGGSPLIARTTENGVTTERTLDLIQAKSLFVTTKHVFTVSAGRTRMDESQADDKLIAAVMGDLEAFLSGLVVHAQ